MNFLKIFSELPSASKKRVIYSFCTGLVCIFVIIFLFVLKTKETGWSAIIAGIFGIIGCFTLIALPILFTERDKSVLFQAQKILDDNPNLEKLKELVEKLKQNIPDETLWEKLEDFLNKYEEYENLPDYRSLDDELMKSRVQIFENARKKNSLGKELF